MERHTQPITLLGAGSWGTALALYLARRGQMVRIWSIDPSEIQAMLTSGENKQFMPGFPLPKTILPVFDLAEAVKESRDILIVVPSVGYKNTLTLLKPFIHPQTRLICATKGLDPDSGKLLDHITADVLGDQQPFAVLSGPSFAREVAAGLPCAVAIASRHDDFLQDLSERFNSTLFRTYTTHDVTGVEIGGVAKNVIAIATGISDGMTLGAGARSALITRGLAEIMRLGLSLGGKIETFVGLSGLGDLILTCSDDLSRNRRFGLAIGKGQAVAAAEKEIGQVVEGKQNAEIILRLAHQQGIEMPICTMVSQILQGQLTAKEAMTQLLSRSPRSEM